MERLSRVVVSGLAVALMASVTLSVAAQGAGVDYWNDVVKGSHPQTYQDLNDATPSVSCTNGGPGFYEHVTSLYVGEERGCWNGSIAQHSLGNPSSGATSTLLYQDPTESRSMAWIKDNQNTLGPFSSWQNPTDPARALAAMVWTKLDSCALHGGGYGVIDILHITRSGSPMPYVYTSDCGQTVTLRDQESGTWVSHTFPGPKTGRWFMTALIWNVVAGVNTLTYYTGYQGEGVVEHVQTGSDSPTCDGCTWGVSMGGNGVTSSDSPGGWSAEWWGLGTWQNANATGLLLTPDGVATTGLSTGQPARWLDILNSFVPFSVKPSTGCIATTSGPQDCTSNPTQQPAPLSGSVKKFQIGYLPIVDCGSFPTVAVSSFFGINLTIPDPIGFVPWALCNAQDVINTAINALIFAANVAIDLAMPDGSGIAQWQKSQTEALTHFPYGYAVSAYTQLGAALGTPGMGSYGCTGTAGGVSSCGYSGGSGSFTFSLHPGQTGSVIDMPALMASAGMGAWQHWMEVVIYGSAGLMVLRAVRGDLAGKPE